MNRLVPEKRLNKNGVLTTKWVKPSSAAAASSLPAPKVTAPEKTREFNVDASLIAMLYRRSTIKGQRSLRDFDMGAVEAVDRMSNKAAALDLVWQSDSAVQEAFNIVSSRIQMGDASGGEYTAFNNLAVFGETIFTLESKRHEVQSLVAGVAAFMDSKDYFLEASDDERSQAVALVTVASRLEQQFLSISGDYYSDDRSIRVRTDELAALIMSRPHDAERIASVINETGSDDAGLVRDVLDHGEQALRGGLL